MDRVNRQCIETLVREVLSEKIKGVDGKSCWKGYRYGGTENGKDICIKIKEADDPQAGKAAPYGSGYAKVKQAVQEFIKEAKKAKETFEEFAKTRGDGAAKIASTAEEKGGLALLTWHHFKVKAPYYKKAVEGKLDLEKTQKEFEETYKKISLNMTQIEFQREVGRLEVLGELLIRDKK